jgi:hypothetical protein
MALVLDDRVQETTTTTGTGTLTLAGAVTGYQSFATIGDGNTTYYNITDGTNWEVGIGTYTSSGTTLSRGIVLSSSNSGALVNFPAGSKNVFVTYPAEKAVYTDTPSTFAFKNRLINGQMFIAQRAASGTSGAAVPTTAPVYPCVDRWYAYATGATVTVAQVAGSGANQYNLRATGAGSVTAIGIGQRIEQDNCYDMAGSAATLSVNISNSLLTTVTWTASYATSADTWSSKTQIATGTFTVTSTLTNYSAQISIPAAATTGIEILFTVGAQTSGTWEIGNVQLEKGSVATAYDYRAYGTELNLCYRYYYKIFPQATNVVLVTGGYAGTTTLANLFGNYPVPMRIVPTSLEQSGTAANYQAVTSASGGVNCTAVPTFSAATTLYSFQVVFTISGMTIGAFAFGRTGTVSGANGFLAWSAEL